METEQQQQPPAVDTPQTASSVADGDADSGSAGDGEMRGEGECPRVVSGVRASWRSHHVVRIPPEEAVLLNSKDKAPYMLQVEVVDCDDFYRTRLPAKQSYRRKLGHTRSQSDSVHMIRVEEGLSRTQSFMSLKDTHSSSDAEDSATTASAPRPLQALASRQPQAGPDSSGRGEGRSGRLDRRSDSGVRADGSSDGRTDGEGGDEEDNADADGDDDDDGDDAGDDDDTAFEAQTDEVMRALATRVQMPGGRSRTAPSSPPVDGGVALQAMNIRKRLHKAASTPESQVCGLVFACVWVACDCMASRWLAFFFLVLSGTFPVPCALSLSLSTSRPLDLSLNLSLDLSLVLFLTVNSFNAGTRTHQPSAQRRTGQTR